jgi:hypothetical protein
MSANRLNQGDLPEPSGQIIILVSPEAVVAESCHDPRVIRCPPACIQNESNLHTQVRAVAIDVFVNRPDLIRIRNAANARHISFTQIYAGQDIQQSIEPLLKSAEKSTLPDKCCCALNTLAQEAIASLAPLTARSAASIPRPAAPTAISSMEMKMANRTPSGPAFCPYVLKSAANHIMVVGPGDEERLAMQGRQRIMLRYPSNMQHALHIPPEVGAFLILRYLMEDKIPDKMFGIGRSSGRTELNVVYIDSFEQFVATVNALFEGTAHLTEEQKRAIRASILANQNIPTPPTSLPAPVENNPPPPVQDKAKTQVATKKLDDYITAHKIDLLNIDAPEFADEHLTNMKKEAVVTSAGKFYDRSSLVREVMLRQTELSRAEVCDDKLDEPAQGPVRTVSNLSGTNHPKIAESAPKAQAATAVPEEYGETYQQWWRADDKKNDAPAEVSSSLNSIPEQLEPASQETAPTVVTPSPQSVSPPVPLQEVSADHMPPASAQPETPARLLKDLLIQYGADPDADREREGLRMQDVLIEHGHQDQAEVSKIRLCLFHMARAGKKESRPSRKSTQPDTTPPMEPADSSTAVSQDDKKDAVVLASNNGNHLTAIQFIQQYGNLAVEQVLPEVDALFERAQQMKLSFTHGTLYTRFFEARTKSGVLPDNLGEASRKLAELLREFDEQRQRILAQFQTDSDRCREIICQAVRVTTDVETTMARKMEEMQKSVQQMESKSAKRISALVQEKVLEALRNYDGPNDSQD